MSPARAFWIFTALSFTITWAFCGLYWLTRSGVEADPGPVVRLGNLLAVWGPTIAGLAMAYFVGGRDNALALLLRIWKLPHWNWLALALAIPAGLQLSGALIGTVFTPYEFLKALPQSIPGFAMTLLFALLSGPLGEEFGWRGFGLDAGAKAFGPLTATFLLGLLWSLWHLPAFIVPGLQDIIFPVGISFWEFSGFTIFGAVIASWLVFNARGALLPAVIFHLCLLMVVQMVRQTPPMTLSLIVMALYAVTAGLIIWRQPDLGYNRYKDCQALI